VIGAANTSIAAIEITTANNANNLLNFIPTLPFFWRKKTAKGIGGREVQKIISKNDPVGLCPSTLACVGLFYCRRLPDQTGNRV
jgi:hypothetical protein